MLVATNQTPQRWPPRSTSLAKACEVSHTTTNYTNTATITPLTSTTKIAPKPRPTALRIPYHALKALPPPPPSSVLTNTPSSSLPRTHHDTLPQNPRTTTLCPTSSHNHPLDSFSPFTTDLTDLQNKALYLHAILAYLQSLIADSRAALAASHAANSASRAQLEPVSDSLTPPSSSNSSGASEKDGSSIGASSAKGRGRRVRWADEETLVGEEPVESEILKVSSGEIKDGAMYKRGVGEKVVGLGWSKVSLEKRASNGESHVVSKKMKQALRKLMLGYQEMTLKLAEVEVEIELVVLRRWADAFVEDF